MHMATAQSTAHKPLVRFLNIISTKRSGHHALIAWIEDCSPQSTLFFNNSVLQARTFEKLPVLARTLTEPTTILLNYEGISPFGVASALARQREADAVIDKVLFIRDPLNVCASLMRRRSNVRVKLFNILRQMFALRNWLHEYQQKRIDADLVFYNRWLVDHEYRDAFANRLSLKPVPIRSEITKFGGGSSFRDLNAGGSAAAPQLLNRWKYYKDDPIFQSIVGHPYFRTAFHDLANGSITDIRGESDYDAERAAYFEKLRRQPAKSAYVSRIIDGLSRKQEVFEQVEATRAGLYKRSLILRAHVSALFAPSISTAP
jgi:hypothetical protein